MLREFAMALDPCLFAAEGLGFRPDEEQAKVLRSTHKRILVCTFRQWGKSTITAIRALWHSLVVDNALTLIVSPSLRQSVELFKRISLMAAVFKDLPSTPEWTKSSLILQNGSRIISLPASESSIRGYSACSLLIFDESRFVPDQVYLAARPMVAAVNGTILMISTAGQKQGFYYRAFVDDSGMWERHIVSVDQSDRLSPQFVEEERRIHPAKWFQREYLCSFTDSEDAVFEVDSLRKLFDPNVEPLFAPVQNLIDEKVRAL